MLCYNWLWNIYWYLQPCRDDHYIRSMVHAYMYESMHSSYIHVFIPGPVLCIQHTCTMCVGKRCETHVYYLCNTYLKYYYICITCLALLVMCVWPVTAQSLAFRTFCSFIFQWRQTASGKGNVANHSHVLLP